VSDPTREAVAAALHKVACVAIPSSCENDPHPYEWEQADAALAVVYSQAWLKTLVVAVVGGFDPDRAALILADVPPSLRAAAGLDTP
jgi:hypothetical protein